MNAIEVSQARPRARRHLPLGSYSTTTPAAFLSKPDCLFSAHDLAAAGLIGSRAALARAIGAGKIPRPIRLPSGRLAWRGRVIADWLDRLEREATSHAA